MARDEWSTGADSALAPPNDADVKADVVDPSSGRHRRHALSALRRTDGDVVEPGEQVQAREADRANDEHGAIPSALHRVHRPKPAACGLIDCDTQRRTVRYDRHPDREREVALAVETAGDVA